MNRYNDNGEMIDVSKLNRSIIAQEIIIERIKDMLESESSTVERLEAFGMGLYASQFQMKYLIQQDISRGDRVVSDYEMELLHILEVTEKNSFGDIIMFNEVNQWIDNWINKQFPHTMELTK
jgi:hypothetical protein